jgi:hypothetical protein
MLKLTKKEIVEKLIDDDIDTILTQGLNSETEYLSNILRKGLKGYNSYTNKELKQEYEERLDPNNEGIKIIK